MCDCCSYKGEDTEVNSSACTSVIGVLRTPLDLNDIFVVSFVHVWGQPFVVGGPVLHIYLLVSVKNSSCSC